MLYIVGQRRASTRGTAVSKPAHPLPAITLLVGSCGAVWKQPSCPCYGPSAWEEEEEERRRLYRPEKWSVIYFRTAKSLSWCDQVCNRAARNGKFWHGDVVLTLLPTGVLHLCPSCHCTGPNIAATAASSASAAAGSRRWPSPAQSSSPTTRSVPLAHAHLLLCL